MDITIKWGRYTAVVVHNGSVTFLLRPVLACSIVLGMVIGLNWCFSEITSALKQVVEPATVAASPQADMPQAFNFLAEGGASGPKLSTAGTSGLPVAKNPPVPNAAGRMDPFAPLAEDPMATGAVKGESALPKDPLADVQYTGMVNGHTGKDPLAMIQINDPLLGQTTVIRRAGQTVDLNGTQFTLSSISTDFVRIHYKGQSRTLALRPLLEPSDNAVGSASGNGARASAPTAGTPVYASGTVSGQR